MSITIKQGHLYDREFLMACRSLEQFRLPVPIAYNISRLNKQLQKAVTESSEFYLSILKKHSVLDEKGDFVNKKNEEGVFIPNTYVCKEGCQEILEKELKEFMDIDVEIKSFPLKMEQLQDALLTGHLISKLEGTVLFE